MYILGVARSHDASDHQDSYIFRIGDPNLNLHVPLLEGGASPQCVQYVYCIYTLPETNIAMENSPFWWYLPGKMVIFHGYVSLPEGIYICIHSIWTHLKLSTFKRVENVLADLPSFRRWTLQVFSSFRWRRMHCFNGGNTFSIGWWSNVFHGSAFS